jgi:endo-1,4-beta-D-glucanase Y
MRLGAIGLFIVLFSGSAAYGLDHTLWERYKTDFVSSDGRIIDYHQGLISHSEGQGYGMRLSVLFDDRTAFEKIWRWTKANLQVRADSLFAWQWGKRPNGEWKVIDYNNATDGDIFIAYALLKALEKWHDAGYHGEALKIIQDIRTNLSMDWHGHMFLLPGYHGFKNNDQVELNPSYSILAAFRQFAKEDQRSFWEKIYQDSLFLIEQSCFGKWCLPADWLVLTDGRVSLSAGRDPYFGNEAIRILLHLSAEKSPHYPKGVEKILDTYKQIGYLPRWIDLEKDSFSLQAASAGSYAVYSLVAKRLGDHALAKKLMKEAAEKLNDDRKGYYSFSLYLLATGVENEQAY